LDHAVASVEAQELARSAAAAAQASARPDAGLVLRVARLEATYEKEKEFASALFDRARADAASSAATTRAIAESVREHTRSVVAAVEVRSVMDRLIASVEDADQADRLGTFEEQLSTKHVHTLSRRPPRLCAHRSCG
jgi:hypothetical protein